MGFDTLIFVPTYNEKDNIVTLFERIQRVGLSADILFLDDNSPDGTGDLMDKIASESPNVSVIHRTGKLGIGSAHKEGIRYAYRRGYRRLLTMDADFTHAPEMIPLLLEQSEQNDVVIASRYLQKESLKGWNIFRKVLTWLGHVLTTVLLGLKYDSTGAFRVYRLDKVPAVFLDKVESNGYSFFFESLHVLNRNGFKIIEVPNALPPRTYGSSKMDIREVFRSVRQLFSLCFRDVFRHNSVFIE
jgi:dolichol-phosphate mannosyltransferase